MRQVKARGGRNSESHNYAKSWTQRTHTSPSPSTSSAPTLDVAPNCPSIWSRSTTFTLPSESMSEAHACAQRVKRERLPDKYEPDGVHSVRPRTRGGSAASHAAYLRRGLAGNLDHGEGEEHGELHHR